VAHAGDQPKADLGVMRAIPKRHRPLGCCECSLRFCRCGEKRVSMASRVRLRHLLGEGTFV